MLIPNVRRIWHFKPQSALHQGMLNPSIANFFAILLQCNSTFSLVSLIFFVLFLLSFSSSLSSLQTQTPSSSQHQHHTSQWLIFFGGLRFGGFYGCLFFLGMGDDVGHYGGCGFWRGSLWWLWFLAWLLWWLWGFFLL